MKRSRNGLFVLGLAIAFISGCGVPGNGPVEATPETGGSETSTGTPDTSSAGGSGTGAGEIIQFAQLGNMSGRGSESVLPYIRGVEERVALINATGVMNGRQISLLGYDTTGSIEITRDLWESSVRESGALVVFLWDMDLLPALLSEIAGWDGIVIVPRADSAYVGAEGPSNLFSLAPPPEVDFLFAMAALAEDADLLPGYAELGQVNLALLSWPVSSGGLALSDASRSALVELGVNLVHEAEIQPSYTWDAGSAIRAAARMEANVIFLAGYSHAPAIVLDELFRQGLQDQVTLVGPSIALDMDVYGYLSSPERYQGFLAPSTLAWWSDTSNAKINAWSATILEGGRSAIEMNRGRLTGALGVDAVVEAIRLALAQNPGLGVQANDLRVALFEIELKRSEGELGDVRFLPSRRYPDVIHLRKVDAFGVFLPWP